MKLDELGDNTKLNLFGLHFDKGAMLDWVDNYYEDNEELLEEDLQYVEVEE